ncbi:MAG: hypothetical protein LBT88_08105 [Oscillospiraceae bacterium]|jgi:hypothetical protein|nr:hypothetical protein [Oscillospiraceae bacterium]
MKTVCTDCIHFGVCCVAASFEKLENGYALLFADLFCENSQERVLFEGVIHCKLFFKDGRTKSLNASDIPQENIYRGS